MPGYQQDELALEPAGRRSERTEWGIRYTRDTSVHRKGEVTPRLGEDDARWFLASGQPRWLLEGAEVVSRTVVTYTTRWKAAR